uniref:Uncharacterized protein n=1 Tax=Astyanax mexicanus TaxID=7994 RepID=A0A8B9KHU3_ASTMX
MLAIQPRSPGRSDEELRAVGVGPCISHLEVFICKRLPIDAFTCRGRLIITSLNHEVFDDTVELAAFVTITFLERESGKSNKVVHSKGDDLSEQPNHNPANLMSSNCDVKKHLRVGRQEQDGLTVGILLWAKKS